MINVQGYHQGTVVQNVMADLVERKTAKMVRQVRMDLSDRQWVKTCILGDSDGMK